MKRKRMVFMLAVGICAAVILGIGWISKSREDALAAAEEPGVALPIVMYHSILNDPNRAGKYIVTPAQVESDLVYLKEKGYTTVTMAEVIDYVNGRGNLPEKPIVISLDDGNYNNYSYLYPLLEKYDMKAVISVIGKYSDLYSQSQEKPNNNYSNLTWETMREMEASGRVEIQSHTYDMHGKNSRKGLSKKPGESDQTYLSEIYADLYTMQDRMEMELGHKANTLAYPFGAMTDLAQQVVEDLGFRATLSCRERISRVVKGEPETLWDLGRFNRGSGKSTEEFFAAAKIL